MAWQTPKTNWQAADVVSAEDLNRIEGNIAEAWAKFDEAAGHKHTGGDDDAPPIPIDGIDSSAKTSPGGTEKNRLAVTNDSGRVGDSERLGGVAASSYARKDASETWTGKPTFAAGVQIGDGNQDLAEVFALFVPLDTRSLVVSQWDPVHTSLPKQIQVKDGSTVLATLDITRNSEGKATQVVVTPQGSRPITFNATWSSGRSWPDSVTKVVL